eukprot:scaffold133084_cov57-Phaeocystis_antarctica.AAC.2
MSSATIAAVTTVVRCGDGSTAFRSSSPPRVMSLNARCSRFVRRAGLPGRSRDGAAAGSAAVCGGSGGGRVCCGSSWSRAKTKTLALCRWAVERSPCCKSTAPSSARGTAPSAPSAGAPGPAAASGARWKPALPPRPCRLASAAAAVS